MPVKQPSVLAVDGNLSIEQIHYAAALDDLLRHIVVEMPNGVPWGTLGVRTRKETYEGLVGDIIKKSTEWVSSRGCG